MRKNQQPLDRKHYPAGEPVFKEVDEGRHAYFVETGEVQIKRQAEDGDERVLGTVGQGDIFGEMALIDDQPRMASVYASKEATLILIARDSFRKRLEKFDPLIKTLLAIFVKNIRALTAAKTSP